MFIKMIGFLCVENVVFLSWGKQNDSENPWNQRVFRVWYFVGHACTQRFWLYVKTYQGWWIQHSCVYCFAVSGWFVDSIYYYWQVNILRTIYNERSGCFKWAKIITGCADEIKKPLPEAGAKYYYLEFCTEIRISDSWSSELSLIPC